ncbi:MAG: ABC transporter ATP-binding protein [Candidatus Lokiarchaeota archaeon]|nr:ABC transporter ATP-binding protein [Candidatus Lokiarchaeota archaeon]
MLRIQNLTVSVNHGNGRKILRDFNLNIDEGETHVLLGPNGSGKSTLIYTILGYPGYIIESGSIFFKGKNITNLPTNQRVDLGIGTLFQHAPKVPGVKLKNLMNVCGEKRGERTQKGANEESALEDGCEDLDEQTRKIAKDLNFPLEFLERDVNVGFSGGEIKRSEIMQMMALKPDLLLIDEPDSGVDVENLVLIGKVLRKLLQRDEIPSRQTKAGLIITHLGYILQYLGTLDRAHILLNGRIICSGNPQIIIESVKKFGFDECKICEANQISLECRD